MKTSIIKSNGIRDSTETKALQSWAAEYAKRAYENEEAERRSADAALQSSIDSHIAERATGTGYSHVKLSDSVSSTLNVDGESAATPLAVKTAYDKAVSAFSHSQNVMTALNKEKNDRKSGDDSVMTALNEEKNDRKSGDDNLNSKISDLNRQLTDEAHARELSDDNLDKSINQCVKDRISATSELLGYIQALQTASHSHDNKAVIDGITDERVMLWDKVKELDTNFEYAEFKALVEDLLYGFIGELQNVYGAIGITSYDGGIFGMEQNGTELDGGGFEETINNTIDCGGFEPLMLSAQVEAVIDCGAY